MERVQLSRAKGSRMPANTVKIDRSGPWGNPFQVVRVTKWYDWSVLDHGKEIPVLCRTKDRAQALAVALYRDWIWKPEQQALRNRLRAEIGGKNHGCWCAIGTPCHGDITMAVAATPAEAEPDQPDMFERLAA